MFTINVKNKEDSTRDNWFRYQGQEKVLENVVFSNKCLFQIFLSFKMNNLFKPQKGMIRKYNCRKYINY